MRIERISENTIRCTLTNFDLSIRNIKMSELTYGSDNARNLFREMMQKAHKEVGFEAEDTPIMVEAIPMPNISPHRNREGNVFENFSSGGMVSHRYMK